MAEGRGRELPPMPAYPSWLTRIPAAIGQLRPLGDRLVTRTDIEVMFGLSKRAALILLRRVGAVRVGISLAIPADRLLSEFEHLSESGDFGLAMERRRCVQSAVRFERAHHVRFRVPAQADAVQGLPAGVRVVPGEITVTFSTVEEGLQRLFLLAQTITADYDRFARIASAPTSPEVQ